MKRALPAIHLSTLAALLALPLVVGCGGPPPLRFGVLFEDAAGIESGAPVIHRGLEVGRVVEVGLDDRGLVLVSVEIEDRYRTAVAKNSVIRVEAGGLFRRRQLSIREGEGERLPVSDGDVLVGRESGVEDWMESITESAREIAARAAELADELEQGLRDLGESQEVEELVDRLRELSREAQERSSEEWRRFREEELPALRRRMEEIEQRLLEEGRDQEAEELKRRFETWLEDPTTLEQQGESSPP